MEDPTVAIAPFQNHHDNNDHDFSSFFNQLLHAHDNANHYPALDFVDQMVMNMDGGLDDDFLVPWDPLMPDDIVGTSDGSGGSKEGMISHDDANNNNNNNNDQGVIGNVNNYYGYDQGNAVLPLQVWPNSDDNNNPSVAYPCSCCQVLREIVHSNGTHTTKFEIHGGVGLVSHAVLETTDNNGVVPGIREYQMLDFCRQSYENVKQYLIKYFEDQRQKGYTLLQDPLSFFYEALCTGYDWVDNSRSVSHVQGNNSVAGQHAPLSHADTLNQATYPPMAENSQLCQAEVPFLAVHPSDVDHQVPRTELAIQRERIKHMALGDFAIYFDRPIEEAAKQLRLCATVMKKKLRQFDIPRWPYRKVKSIKRKISEWSEDLGAENAQLRVAAESEISRLQQQLADILNGNVGALVNIQ